MTGPTRRGAGLCLALLLIWSAALPVQAAEQPEFELEAEAAILMDAASGRVIFEKAADKELEPASMTKIMTLLLAMEALAQGKVKLDDPVTASEYATSFGGSQIYLEPGETMTLEEMLYAIAVGSANDASVAVAEYLAGSESAFVDRMNEKAREIGMRHTQFQNPHGLPAEGHYSSARDMALLARYIVLRHPEMLKYTGTWEHYLREDTPEKFWLVNTNRGVRFYSGMDGLKTGWTTTAGYCLTATARRGDTRMIAVVMGHPDSKDRFQEVYSLLNYGFSNFESVPVARAGEPVEQVPVYEGRENRLGLAPEGDVLVTVPKGEKHSIRHEVRLTGHAVAPVTKGQVLGELLIYQGEELIRKVPLVAAQAVPRASFGSLYLRLTRQLWPLMP